MARAFFSRPLAALALLACLPAQAGLITMNYSGAVSGYFSLGILQDDFPLNTPVAMALTYEDSFIGAPASQYSLGMAAAVSGTMDLGGSSYTITGMRLNDYGRGATMDDPAPNYAFHLTGSGPATDDGEVFSGIYLFFSLGTLGSPQFIGFGNTNWALADNGFLLLSGTATHERIATPVPEPGTALLLLAGLGTCAALRRRSALRG